MSQFCDVSELLHYSYPSREDFKIAKYDSKPEVLLRYGTKFFVDSTPPKRNNKGKNTEIVSDKNIRVFRPNVS